MHSWWGKQIPPGKGANFGEIPRLPGKNSPALKTIHLCLIDRVGLVPGPGTTLKSIVSV